nr:MAG TPA: hypothetical protein [Caudoviricetes sp.]
MRRTLLWLSVCSLYAHTALLRAALRVPRRVWLRASFGAADGILPFELLS